MKQIKQMNFSHKQQGFTLVEIAIVLMIIGVFTAMAIAGITTYNQVQDEAVAKSLNSVVLATQTKLRNDATTTGLNNTAVINSGVLNKSGWTFVAATSTITHQKAATVTFAPATLVSANDAISVAMSGIPYGTCSNLGRDATLHAYKITIGATIAQTTPDTPATGAAIDAACGSSGVKTMTMIYTKNP